FGCIAATESDFGFPPSSPTITSMLHSFNLGKSSRKTSFKAGKHPAAPLKILQLNGEEEEVGGKEESLT
ncbi:hypothetical protein KK473_28080, partial [Klebsiella pneumoniae]|uniref:hypothetical protein n=1 Tax=Klebsiella pneumoniae TaxID=573 RepID=UPI001BE0A96D